MDGNTLYDKKNWSWLTVDRALLRHFTLVFDDVLCLFNHQPIENILLREVTASLMKHCNTDCQQSLVVLAETGMGPEATLENKF